MGRGYWTTSTGSTYCPECGGDPVIATSPRVWTRISRWLTLGKGAGPTLTCEAGHTWRAGSFAALTLRHPSRAGKWLRLPLQLFRRARHARTMTPVPVTYLMAAVVGVLLGAAADLTTDFPWWVVAVGFVGAVWVFFMSTAFWGPHRLRRIDVLRMVNPERARAEERAALETAVRTGELPAYAVAGWRGSLGGWGGGHHDLRSITLRFVDDSNERRWIEVETVSGSRLGPVGLRKEHLAENLVGRIPDVPQFDRIDEQFIWHRKREHEYEELLRNLAWLPATLVVDGSDVDAEVARVDDGIAVYAPHGQVVIEVMARNVELDNFTLVAVTNLAPFFDEMEARRKR